MKRWMKPVALFLVLLAASWPAAAGPETVRVNVVTLPGTSGLSLVKLFADHPDLGPGVTADYLVVKGPEQAVARLVSGEADVAALPTNTAAILYNKGAAVRLAAITNWGVMYVVGRLDGVDSWRDLKGREIALTNRGATPDILFNHFIRSNGLDPEKDLRLQYYASAAELAQLLAAGRVSCAVLPEPWVTEAMRLDPKLRILLDFQEEWRRLEKSRGSYPQSCLVVRAPFAAERRPILDKLLKEIAFSSAWVNEHPVEAGKLAQEFVQIPAETAAQAIPRCYLRFEEAGEARPAVDAYLRKLFGFDPQSVGGKVPDAGFYL